MFMKSIIDGYGNYVLKRISDVETTPEFMSRMKEEFSAAYNMCYNAAPVDNVPGFRAAVDAYYASIEELRPLLRRFNLYRYEVLDWPEERADGLIGLASDREGAATVFALERLGLITCDSETEAKMKTLNALRAVMARSISA